MCMWDDYGIKYFGYIGVLMGYCFIFMYLLEYEMMIVFFIYYSYYCWYDLVNDVLLEMVDYYRQQ